MNELKLPPIDSLPRTIEHTYLLIPAECNASQRLPIQLLINRLIEVATMHADILGIGWAQLAPLGQTWVLSRVAVEMTRYPSVNERYTIRTWINSMNRLFSERDFEILDGEGAAIGYARTMWAVLDVNSRQGCDISAMMPLTALIPTEGVCCPIDKPGRPRPLSEFTSRPYRFKYCDIDFNRHVNSSRYIELLLNSHDLHFYDTHMLRRFEIAYIREAYFGENVEVRLSQPGEVEFAELIQIPENGEETHGAATPLCRATFMFSEVKPDEAAR